MSDTIVSEATADELVDRALDIIDNNVVEVVEKFRTNPLLLTGVAVASLAIGAVGGFFVARKYLEPKYAALADEEIRKSEQFHAALHKTGEFSDVDGALRAVGADVAADALSAYGDPNSAAVQGFEVIEDDTDGTLRIKTGVVHTESGDEVTSEVEIKSGNIFLDGQPIDTEVDYAAEVANRDASKPFVITDEEFFANDADNEQWQMTYFAGDDVLINEESEVVEDVEELVGEENLKLFGHLSKDKHIVYVRNQVRSLDFEIARSRGKYAKEVLGLDDVEERPHRRARDGGDE